MPINAYLSFNGNCREAVKFYAKVFKVETQTIATYGDMSTPENPIPAEMKKLVMHTYLDILGTRLMFADSFPGMPFTAGTNISLAVITKDIKEIQSAFKGLKVGGVVGEDLQETSWSKCYGNLTNRFGIKWQFSLEQ